jgi:hypothetical protein
MRVGSPGDLAAGCLGWALLMVIPSANSNIVNLLADDSPGAGAMATCA